LFLEILRLLECNTLLVPGTLSGMEGQAHAGLQICTFPSFFSFPASVREGLSIFNFSLSAARIFGRK